MSADRAPVLSFLGGTNTVTGSRFLVETSEARVLVDAGLFQGLKPLRLRNRAPFPVDPSSLDAVIVTHAHLDHVGYLPALVRGGFAGPVLCTGWTAELAAVVLADSAHLQEEEAAYANRKGYSRHHPATPLYTAEDAQRACTLFRPVGFGERVEAAPGISLVLQAAGHILGSSSASLTLGGERRLFVSGDVGRPGHPILNPPATPPAADVMLIESTYGNRRHQSQASALELLAQTIVSTAKRGGVVIIPVFAVDRTEVVLLALRELVAQGRIPALPVYADSPMALDVLRIYRRAIRERDPQIHLEPGTDDPFDPGKLEEVRTPEESMALNALNYPAVILAASGMATGGRVLHHLVNRLPDPRNTVVIAGFQAEGTRGRRLADGERALKMLGRYVPVRAEVVEIDAFSVHADADELVEWLRPCPAPETAFVVHGSPDASAALRQRLESELHWTAVVPGPGERVRLD